MCFERDSISATRERPVDQPKSCQCSIPESIQIVARRIQMLSFDDLAPVGSGEEKKATIDGRARNTTAA